MEIYERYYVPDPRNSQYYAIMIEKMGKRMADYYWNKRYRYEMDYMYIEECEEIIDKCDKFLKSRNIKSMSVWQPANKKKQ